MKTYQLPVKITTKAKRNEICHWQADRLIIKIKSTAEKNKANIELIRFLSKKLNIPQTDIIISKGMTSNKKIITINGCDESSIKNKLNKI